MIPSCQTFFHYLYDWILIYTCYYLSLIKFFVTCLGNHARARSISDKHMKKIISSIQSESDEQILKERECLREDWRMYATSFESSKTWESHGKKMALNM